MNRPSDQWSAAATYEEFMGRWSRELSRRFIDWLEPASQLRWLEVGCGTGALTSAICSHADPASVVACDPSADFVRHAQDNLNDDRVAFHVASADDFPFDPEGYDQTTSMLALNFFPSPHQALQRMRSGTRRGGTVSACVWDYGGAMEFLRYFWDAAATIAPSAGEADEGNRFPMCNPAKLEALFVGADLEAVTCDALDIETAFTTFDDYWWPFLGGTGPAPSFLASLDPVQQNDLKAALEKALPMDRDGAIRLRARAWAIRGVRTGDNLPANP